MTTLELVFAVAGALLVGVLFYYLFRTAGPWGSLWSFILILILAAIAAELWISDAGPRIYEVAWLPTLFVIFIFALLLAAASPPRRSRIERASAREIRREEESVVAFTAFFWIMLIFFVLAILVGLLII